MALKLSKLMHIKYTRKVLDGGARIHYNNKHKNRCVLHLPGYVARTLQNIAAPVPDFPKMHYFLKSPARSRRHFQRVRATYIGMTSSLGTHPRICSLGGGPEHIVKERSCKISCFRYTDVESSWKELFPSKIQKFNSCRHLNTRKCWSIFSAATGDANDPDDSEDSKNPPENENESVNSEILRGNLERIVGRDDSAFSGIDLAALIRNKYGRSYDVQLIKKEFMGKNLLALNVMWKYREQRSFPLTEEEYLLRLDDVANTLKCWGAVSHIRNSLEKLKERPRIGKAVSIFIDMDESGGRANEWIYK